MIAVAVAVGLAIGLLLGALGGGGSILAVPALVYLLDQPPHAATTGALVVVGASAGSGLVAHLRAGRVRVGAGVLFGALGAAGTVAGSRASAAVDPDLLLALFAALMAAASVALVRQPGRARSRPARAAVPTPVPAGAGPGTDPGGPDPGAGPTPHRGRVAMAIRIVLTATVVGLLAGFFGVGGGFIVVPALVLVLRYDMPAAVGTSLLVIAINAATALAVRAGSAVTLDWPLLGTFAGAAMAGSLAGHQVTTRVSPRRLAVAFAGLCLLLAGYVAVRSVPRLLLG